MCTLWIHNVNTIDLLVRLNAREEAHALMNEIVRIASVDEDPEEAVWTHGNDYQYQRFLLRDESGNYLHELEGEVQLISTANIQSILLPEGVVPKKMMYSAIVILSPSDAIEVMAPGKTLEEFYKLPKGFFADREEPYDMIMVQKMEEDLDKELEAYMSQLRDVE